MAKLSQDRKAGTRHPRENILAAGSLASVNAEIIIEADGANTVSLDVRGTFVGTLVVEGTTNGTDWDLITVRQYNRASLAYLIAVTNTQAPGTFTGDCVAFDRVRVRMSAYTSGAAVTALMATSGRVDQTLIGAITQNLVTATGAAAAAVTATLAAPGAGLRHYITYLSISRFATAALTAAAAPVLVTTTNLPGALVINFPAEAALQGTIDRWREDFAFPIAASAQNTATTVVAPVTTGVIWRITVGFYVAP
jgi:hypothetical protein